jgi:cation transport regulator ChaC
VSEVLKPQRDAQRKLEQTIAQWGGQEDLWIFGYGSLIWGPISTSPSDGRRGCTAGTAR